MTTAISRGDLVQAAIDLDHDIDDAMRSFVELGTKLIEMRDTGLFRSLPNPFKEGEKFDTFEEYCAAKGQIGKRYARTLIRSSLAYKALDFEGTNSALKPTAETHARVLADNVVVFDTRAPDTGTGHRGGERHPVPIGVTNHEQLNEIWDKVAAKYQKAHKADPRRKLTATFIYDALPSGMQHAESPTVQTKDPRWIAKVPRAGQKLIDLIGYPDHMTLDDLNALAESEAWTQDSLDGIRALLKKVDGYVKDIRDLISRIRL